MSMERIITVAFNLLDNGQVVAAGDHSPGTSDGSPYEDTGISAIRVATGAYRIFGKDIAWPEGWCISIYRDDEDVPTLRVKRDRDADGLTLDCLDPSSGEPKDIVHMLTLRVAVAAP